MVNFYEVVQAHMKELQSMISVGAFESRDVKLYAEAFMAYLHNDSEAVASYAEEFTDVHVRLLLTVRAQILDNNVEIETLEKLERCLRMAGDWEGEIAYVLGRAYTDIQEYHAALRCYKIAHKKLWSIGARKKAVHALLNIALTETLLAKMKDTLVTFDYVKDRAMEVGDTVLAGVCYYNIAREHQRQGNFEQALDFVNTALEHLSDDRSSIHFSDAVLLRCHIYTDLARLSEAQVDLQSAKATRHQRVLEGAKFVERLLNEKKQAEEKSKQA